MGRLSPPPAGYTPDTHPLRNVKPDDWMLRNLRQTSENVRSVISTIDLTRKDKP